MTSDDVNWDQLRESHAAEAQERLATMEKALLDLEAGEDPVQMVDLLQRQAHTLKGNAGLFDFGALVELSHAFEDALAVVKKRAQAGQPIKRELPTLFKGLDGLRTTLANAASGDKLAGETEILAHALRGLGATEGERAAEPAAVDPLRPSAAGGERAGRAFLRVDLRRIDRLVDLASELSVARGRIASAMTAETVSEALKDVVEESLGLIDHLGDLALGMRLVALGPTLQAQRRTVRDAAAALGKDATLAISGDDVELDLSLIDLVREALGHLTRNAVAHGIEPPGARAARGKPRAGQIAIRAFQETSQVMIEVEDDGAGLDVEAIRARAEEMKVQSGEKLSDISRLVFLPGLSTARELTGVSGRGVGLDAVRESIENVGGSIDVQSRPGEGALFRVRLPLTLVALSGLHVTVADQPVIIPLDLVQECEVMPPVEDGDPDSASFVVRQAGRSLPVLRLSQTLFGAPRCAGESLVVVQQSGHRVGLAVDSLGGAARVVVRPMSRYLKRATSVLGAAILGDGHVALILDIPDLIRRATGQAQPSGGMENDR
jgi:two-component system chemotaxis sensor kinase CheA